MELLRGGGSLRGGAQEKMPRSWHRALEGIDVAGEGQVSSCMKELLQREFCFLGWLPCFLFGHETSSDCPPIILMLASTTSVSPELSRCWYHALEAPEMWAK
jgi:hypothetical protein